MAEFRNWCVEAMDLADIKKVLLADVKKQEPDVELPSRAGARRRSSSGSSNGGRRMIRLLSVDTKKNERWVGQEDSKTTDGFSSSTSLGAIAATGRPGHPLTRTRRRRGRPGWRNSLRESGREDDLDLMYDPILNCYYDPKTNKYYELAMS